MRFLKLGAKLFGFVPLALLLAVAAPARAQLVHYLDTDNINQVPVAVATPLPVTNGSGTAIIGKVGIDQTTPGTTNGVVATLVTTGAGPAVSLTRTNDTNAYTAGDVIGTATGSTAALTFAVKPGQFMITGVSIEVDISAVVSGMTNFNLELYNVTPPSALGDNAAWDLPSGDRASYLGVVNLGTPVDVGSTLYVYTAQVNQQVLVPAGGNLFAYLTTAGAWTPAANTVFVVTVYGFAL